jgi:hypothetical protein
MRGPVRAWRPSGALRPTLVALGLGALAACYQDDYLLGARCLADEDCGDLRCCGRHCRPVEVCGDREVDDSTPFTPAYRSCDDDEACREFGLPHCAHVPTAARGFCTDYCIDDPSVTCEKHEFGYPNSTIPRVCTAVGGRSLCTLDCSDTGVCPPTMRCTAEVCVPN